MKTILLASALLIGGVAHAQADPHDAGQPIGSGATLTPGTTMGERDTMGKNAVKVVRPAPATGTMSTGTMSSDTTTSTMSSGATMSTDTSMGTTGSGTVTTVQEGGNMTAPPAASGSYPRCSRTVTDHCQQGSARESDTKGGPPARRRARR